MTRETKPPANARRIWNLADLPQDRRPATYLIQTGDERPRRVTLQKRQRQILDLLRAEPVYAASPVRISDIVHVLKRDIGLDVETLRFPGNAATGSGSYGIYVLRSTVSLVIDVEAAE